MANPIPIAKDVKRYEKALVGPGGFECTIILTWAPDGTEKTCYRGQGFSLQGRNPIPMYLYFGVDHRPTVAPEPLGDEITYFATLMHPDSGTIVPGMTDSQTVTITPGNVNWVKKQLPLTGYFVGGQLLAILQFNVGNKIDGSVTGDSTTFPFSVSFWDFGDAPGERY